MKILLATQNLGKYKEIKRMLEPLSVEVILPEEKLDVEENGKLLYGKRIHKGNGIL
jgi:XTP/dITP diphosphohydrolase